ncbi:MAG: iron-sulfur cluster repair di-iron protein [Bacilli bacterium]
MSTTFKETEKLGDIVVKFPNAGNIFKLNGIDFCCGGDQLLSEAAAEHNIDVNRMLEELNGSYDEFQRLGLEIVDWTSVPLRQLADHIVNTHHAYLRQVFPPLTELTTKILRVHGKNHGDVLSKVHRLFSTLRIDMEEHMIKEEEIVFPQVMDYEKNPSDGKRQDVIRAVQELDREHDGAGDIVKQIRKATDNFKLPEDACSTYIYTFEKLQEVESDIFQHIHLENNVLFPRLTGE